jgi:phage major head subunit gpT-like protein
MPNYDYSGPHTGSSFDQLPAMFTAFRAAFDEELGASLSFDRSPFVLKHDLNGGLVLDLETVRGIAIMKLWAGTKVIEDALKGFGNIIKTIRWEATERINRDEYNSNPNGLGLITPKIAGLADEAQQHALRMFAATLEANAGSVSALTTLGIETDLANYLGGLNCLDGTPLFYASHPKMNGDTYSNITTSALSTASLLAARIGMGKFSDELHNRRVDGRPTTLMVPIDLAAKAAQLAEAEYDPEKSTRTPNPNKGSLSVVVNPFLLDPNNWYLINGRRAQMKPVVEAITYPSHLVQQASPEAESVFMRGDYLFGAEGRYVMVPGHPFTCYGGIVA